PRGGRDSRIACASHRDRKAPHPDGAPDDRGERTAVSRPCHRVPASSPRWQYSVASPPYRCAGRPEARVPEGVAVSDTGKLPGEVYSPGEVRRIIATCSWRASTGRRDAALISVLFQAGLRIHEALDLEVPDVRLDDGTLHVRHGKNDRARFAAIAGDPRFL